MQKLISHSLRLGLAAATLGGFVVAGGTGTASADGSNANPGGHHVVFVQTDNVSGNQVVAYDRAANGSLTLAGTYDTGGLGGVLAGSVVDHLASQGSLTFDQVHSLLFAVNAGSNSVSVFSVQGDRLRLRQVVGSGGTFPVSVAVRGNLVSVLNAENGGSLQEFSALGGRLFALPGESRALGLNPSATPQFVNTPGQVAYSPDGSKLIVTTKANGDDIDVFGVGRFGELSTEPVVNSDAGAVPFAITFDGSGNLVIAEAGTKALSTFTLNVDDTVTKISSLGTGYSATCWVATANGYFYASNAGSGNVSVFTDNQSGALSLLGTANTDGGTVDAAASPGGAFVYVQTGLSGIVDEFSVNPDGSLDAIGSVTVAGAVGGEGIVAL